MFNKYVLTISALLVITFASVPLGLSRSTVLAHGHGHKHHSCRDCEHYVCKGDCGKCVECLAMEKAEKCENCGHVDCPSNCDWSRSQEYRSRPIRFSTVQTE